MINQKILKLSEFLTIAVEQNSLSLKIVNKIFRPTWLLLSLE